MKTQLTRISIHQTSKVVAILYTIITFIIALVMAMVAIYQENYGTAVAIIIIAPIFYGIVGYLISAFIYLIYNWIAKRFGGIEFTLTQLEKVSLMSNKETYNKNLSE